MRFLKCSLAPAPQPCAEIVDGRGSGDGAEFIAFLKCSLAPAPQPRAAITGWRLLKGEGRGTGPTTTAMRRHPQRHEGPPCVSQRCWLLWAQPPKTRAIMWNLSGRAPFQLHPTRPANSIHCPPPAPIIHHLPPTIHLPSTSIHPSTQLPSTHPFITHPGSPSPIHTHPTSTHHAGWNPPPTIYTYPPAYYPSIRIHSTDLPIRPSTLPV